jgi:hypothetical protein
MHVEGRRLGILSDRPLDAGQAREQAQQRPRRLQDDARPRGGERRIAAELDRVAKTLLGVQQQYATAERLARPQRLREPARRRIEQPPPPFVFPPALGELAVLQQSQRKVLMALRR